MDHLQYLGRAVADVYSIEFQKRGLPHCHMLIIFREEDKFTTPEKIDEVVSAEIPNPVTHPRLYELVTKHMIHGRSGVADPDSPCMEDGKCKAHFPKEFGKTTELNVGGYPLYRRREMEPVTISRKSKTKPFEYKEHLIDNRHVVPYNAGLLLKYDCHINVEICTSVSSVKYIYKYIYKGQFIVGITFKCCFNLCIQIAYF